MKIPTWDEAADLCENDEGTPLDWFIFNNEPLDDVNFREELQALVDFVVAQDRADKHTNE